MIVITGATGQLGQHIVEQLRAQISASSIVAIARDPEKAERLAQLGIQVRVADYDQPHSWQRALTGASKLLLISSNELGRRVQQHRVVIEAARSAGVGFVAYTSILHADGSTLALAEEHKATEQVLRESGLAFALLRNGWYMENYTERLGSALQHGAFIGSAARGRIAAATRSDYAAAAVKVLTGEAKSGALYELAGDASFTMDELAAEVSRQLGRTIAYRDLPTPEYQRALVDAGLPKTLASALADADAGVARGELDDRSQRLSALLGRPTTSLRDAVASALAKLER
jgi:NAD(P)H dehydrogenase (quinone)